MFPFNRRTLEAAKTDVVSGDEWNSPLNPSSGGAAGMPHLISYRLSVALLPRMICKQFPPFLDHSSQGQVQLNDDARYNTGKESGQNHQKME